MRRLVAVLAATALAFPLLAADAGDDTLWFRATEGECAEKVYSLSDLPGPGESACGYRGGLPLDPVLESPKQYSMERGLGGFVLGGTELTGQLEVGHSVAGGGHYEIEVSVRINGKNAGSATIVQDTGGAGSNIFDFAITVDDALVGQTVEKLSVEVMLGGYFVNSGYLQMDNSFINVPRA